jgi:hypothetical protein
VPSPRRRSRSPFLMVRSTDVSHRLLRRVGQCRGFLSSLSDGNRVQPRQTPTLCVQPARLIRAVHITA